MARNFCINLLFSFFLGKQNRKNVKTKIVILDLFLFFFFYRESHMQMDGWSVPSIAIFSNVLSVTRGEVHPYFCLGQHHRLRYWSVDQSDNSLVF